MPVSNPCVTFIYPFKYGLVIYLLYANILLGVLRRFFDHTIKGKFFDYAIKLQNGALDPLVYRCLSCSAVTIGDQCCI